MVSGELRRVAACAAMRNIPPLIYGSFLSFELLKHKL